MILQLIAAAVFTYLAVFVASNFPEFLILIVPAVILWASAYGLWCVKRWIKQGIREAIRLEHEDRDDWK